MRRTYIFALAYGLCMEGLSAQVITTVAGTDWIFPPFIIAAEKAPLGTLEGVAVDPNGNVFVADVDNHMVMRIASDGTLTIIAGNGKQGFSGDGGAATSAALGIAFSLKSDVAVDANGNVYVADTLNFRFVGGICG